jgi:uncharacterized repeat protein (TIGR01451 family)
MRVRGWGLSVGIVCAAAALVLWGPRSWGQPGELPGLRPPSSPPVLPNGLTTPLRGSEALPVAAPAIKLPSPGVTEPLRTRGTDAFEMVPGRLETQAPIAGTEGALMGKQEPAVSIEWTGPVMARLNQTTTYHIHVRNTGLAPVHNVMIRHPLNAGVVCKRTEPPAVTDRDTLVWTVGTLPPGQQRKLELQVVCSQRGGMACHATASFSTVAGQNIQVREPLLMIKMRAPEKANAGEKFNLIFAVANPGDGVTEAVKVKATLPDGPEGRGRLVEMNIGNLAPKETRTFQIPCVAKPQGTHKCTILASAEGNLSSTDETETEILEPKLALAVQGPKLRYLDRKAAYTFKVTNPGGAPAVNVTLNEVVPAGFKFHAATNGGRWDESTKSVSWQIGDLPPGETREVSVDLVATAAGDHRLQAQAVAGRGLKAEASTVTRVEGASSLSIDLVDVDDPIEVGGETSYEIRVINSGTKMETNLELICTLPEQCEFKGAKSVSGIRHRVEGREVIFDPVQRLAPKADVIYRVTVRGTQAGDARFRARVRADNMPEPVLREESTRFYNDNIIPK